jgi:hypothetical protein
MLSALFMGGCGISYEHCMWLGVSRKSDLATIPHPCQNQEDQRNSTDLEYQ